MRLPRNLAAERLRMPVARIKSVRRLRCRHCERYALQYIATLTNGKEINFSWKPPHA